MGHTEAHGAGASLVRWRARGGHEIATTQTAASDRDSARERGHEPGDEGEPGDDTRPLTAEQRKIVEFGEGPAVVIAGAGTGKTRVIVERVRWLLSADANGYAHGDANGGAEAGKDLQPEQILVLTYNVKAARELRERIQAAIGPATAARLTVANFHSFCVRVLTESSAEADMPAHPDVLDGIGQYLLIRDLRQQLGLVYHTPYAYGDFVRFINRAKDELVSPDDFDAYAARERKAFEDRYGPYADAAARLLANGNL
jgi:ATP-dependent DNA helicase UvrD/PcrA